MYQFITAVSSENHLIDQSLAVVVWISGAATLCSSEKRFMSHWLTVGGVTASETFLYVDPSGFMVSIIHLSPPTRTWLSFPIVFHSKGL